MVKTDTSKQLLATAVLLLCLGLLLSDKPERAPLDKSKISIVGISVSTHRHRVFSQVSGQITNHDSRSYNLELKMLFYSRDGGVVGRAKGMVQGLEPGVTRTFKLFTTTDISGYVRHSLAISEVP